MLQQFEPLSIIILAAGKGTRMRSRLHKTLHKVGGRPMIDHVLDTAKSLKSKKTILVVGDNKEQLFTALEAEDIHFAHQNEQKGTAHAVQMAEDNLKDYDGDIAILYADTPLISPEAIEEMQSLKKNNPEMEVVTLGFETPDPTGYGRLVLDQDGKLLEIVEEKDADDKQKQITLCNSGVMLVSAKNLFAWIKGIRNENASGEYYLTDLVSVARANGATVGVIKSPKDQVMGVNSRADLAAAESAFQRQMRCKFLEAGITMTAPDTVFFSYDTELAPDVTIEPHVVFGPNVKVEEGVTVKAFSHIEGAYLAKGASVGPYARLRPGTQIGTGAKVGNFVEIKKADIGVGSKVSHLTYIGDAVIGADANIGAGTITCNYDGYSKHQTVIGDGAFIGSNTALVAPVNVGSGAIVGAGSTITSNVPEDAISVTRAPQKNHNDAAKRFRRRAKDTIKT